MSITTPRIRLGASVVAAALAFGLAVRAEAPHVYAIKGARLVTVSSASIGAGTIVVRNGLIEAVGADVQPPSDAVVIDGSGLSVYPGLIDMGTTAGTDLPTPGQPQAQPQNQPQQQGPRTFDDAERAKRAAALRPQVLAAEHVRLDSPELARFAAAGVTSVLATPPGLLIKGQSALVNVTTPEMEPIVGAIATPRAGLDVLRSPVALHIEIRRPGGDGYPEALLGAIAFVRQSFIDAQYQQSLEQRYQKSPAGVLRPPSDPALDALQVALAGRVPVAFEANLQREVWRALTIAKEFKLSPLITGGQEADLVAGDLKAANAKVVISLNYPSRPRSLAPDADEPARELRLRAHAPKVAAGLAKAAVPFAFSSSGLQNETEFLKNAAKAVKEGLAEDVALRALTLDAARIAGAADRIGSLEKGKIANLLVTDGDLFAEKTKVKHVFVDGRMVDIDIPEAPQGRGRGRGNESR